MRLNILALLLMMAVNAGVDFYVLRVVRRRTHRRWLTCLTAASVIAGWILCLLMLCMPLGGASDGMMIAFTWLMTLFFALYVPKYIFVIFDLAAKIPELFHRRRLRFLTWTGAALGVAAVVMMAWGAFVNRFRIDVVEIAVDVRDLPEGFDGFTIAQFSDLHTGTFGRDTAFVGKLVDRINSLDADMVVFTGDIVNRHSDEMVPFVDVLSRLRGRYGVYAVLGNHDYGDYCEWNREADKTADRRRLRRLYEQTSLELLTDESRIITVGGDSIALIGVENTGRPPFQAYGSLRGAYPDLSDETVKILLSHDPSHWLDSIADRPDVNIALTLSGHTHAMQFKLGRFSPASLHHRAWAGLYKDKSGDRQLYVNIGAGEVGPPMRIGATPEITLITLRRK